MPFLTVVSTQYHGGESAPISPAAFAVKDGRLVGIVEAGVDTGRDAGEGAAGQPYMGTTVLRNESTGLEDLEILAGGEDFGKLANGVIAAVADLMNRHGSRPEFSGEIRVVILAHTPVHVKKDLPRLQEHLKGVALMAQGLTSQGLRISLTEQAGSSPFDTSRP